MKPAFLISTAALACGMELTPRVVLNNARPMNKEDWLHDIATNPRLYGRKEQVQPDLAVIAKELKDLGERAMKGEQALQAAVKKATDDAAAGLKLSEDAKKLIEKAVKDLETMAARCLELEQKAAKLQETSGILRVGKSWGEQYVESDGAKAFMGGGAGKSFRMQVKTITSSPTGDGGAGDLIRPDRLAGIQTPAERRLTIRDLLPTARTSSNAIEYVQETGFTNSAAPVAEAAEKPESSLSFTLITTAVRTIAHWIRASKQVLADVPALQSYIDGRLRRGIKVVEEDQILAGDGTGQNLFGIIPQATPYNRPSFVGDTRIDIIRRAMTQVRLAEYASTGIVLYPTDWEAIELVKTTEGAYVWGNPRGLLNPTIWGQPVIDTTAVEEGQFLLGAWNLGAEIWDREENTVEVSLEDRDNFIRNLVTIRAEERLALAVYRPEAFVFGDFDDVVSE